MADQLPPGPLDTIATPGSTATPFYMIPFDKNGDCVAPETLNHLIEAADGVTDVIIAATGWNNTWHQALQTYNRFIAACQEVRHQMWDLPSRECRSLIAGVFWPSIVLAGPDGNAPLMAAEPSGMPLLGADEVGLFAEYLDALDAQRLHELVRHERLDPDEARQLAELVAPALEGVDDELGEGHVAPTADDLLEIWAQLPVDGEVADEDGEVGGFIDDAFPQRPTMAGSVDAFDPAQIVRDATVLVMKDRAGRVGAGDVAEMLRRLLDLPAHPRVHLVGHSYGGKVMLSALCSTPVSQHVESVLLLQPAMSCLCFAGNVDGTGRSGGYRPALERTHQALMTTFSGHDVPLTKLFHMAVRRRSDLGEAVIAGAPPSKYAALGGFGPQGVPDDVVTVEPQQPPNWYDLRPAGKRIIAVHADAVIGGHSDVSNPATAWMLLNQVMG